MNINDYQSAMVSCILAAKDLIGHDLPDILAQIDKAETIGPFLDPTLYRQKAKAMEEDKQMLEAALPLWKMGKKLEVLARLSHSLSDHDVGQIEHESSNQ